MALKSVLLRNCFARSSVGELGLRDANSQSRGAAFGNSSVRWSGSLAGAGLREGVRFGRWVLGRRMGGSGVGGVGGASSREIGAELALQCHSVAALRVRRILKILQLYKEIYSERTLTKFVQTSKSRFSGILGGNAISGFRSSAGTVFAACLFHWKEESISEAELQVCIDDVKQLEKIKKVLEGDEGGGGGGGGGGTAAEGPVKSEDDGDQGYEVHSLQANGNGNHGSSHESNCSSQNGNHSAKPLSLGGADPCSDAAVDDDPFLEGWEPVHDRPQMKIWRRPIFDGQLFQYKVYGTWDDVPASAFYLIQVDLDYRKSWDKLVVKLDVIDRDSESGAEVVHWVTHFPFPMSQRDYVYVRRFMVDHDNNIAVFMSKGVEHPKEPVRKKIVRVHRYMSNMVIKPHSSFSEEGLDYVLTYYDDPQATIPSAAMSWMASTGLPKFTEELRSATLDFVKSKGMPVVEDMFRRRIGEQPLATLNPQKQKKILQEAQEEAAAEERREEEEEAEEEAKWRRAVNNDDNNNINNDNLERIGLTDGRADVLLTRMSKEVDSSFRLARGGGDAKEEAALVAEAEEVIVAPAAAMAAAAAAKGEETADLIEIAEAVAKGEAAAAAAAAAAADLVEIVEIAAAAAKSEEAAADVVEMVDIEKKDPDVVERPELAAVKDLSAKVDPDEEVLMFGLVEGENGRRDKGAEEDPSSRSLPDLDDIPIRHCVVAADNDNDVDGSAAAATTTTSMAPWLNANNSRAAETDSYPAEPITSTVHSLSAVDEAQPLSSPPPTMLTPSSHWDVVVASLDVLSSTSLRQNQKGLSPTLRDLVWELSSSSSDSVFSLQGRDYPGIHAYNRAYLTSRSGVVFRGVDAFCAVH